MASRATKFRLGAAVLAAGMVIAAPFIGAREGESLTAYKDVAGVWTICGGVTAGVRPGMRMTQEQCGNLTHSTIGQFMVGVVGLLTVPVSPATLAAHTSLSYNIGIDAYKRSSTLRLTNAGKPREGCEAMKLWRRVGERDCSQRKSGCYGLWLRRLDEAHLCLSGLD